MNSGRNDRVIRRETNTYGHLLERETARKVETA